MRAFGNPKTMIIVTGGPGTGKSYGAAKIEEEFEGLKKLSYDEIKEKNWDIFGFDNKEQKEALNKFGLEEFYLYVQKSMRNTESILLEYPFYQYHRPRLFELAKEYGYNVITVYMYGDSKVVYERSVCRDKGGKRHPGHLTERYHKEEVREDEPAAEDAIPDYEAFLKWLKERNYDIRLGYTIAVNVTDFSKINYGRIMDEIAAHTGPEDCFL
ncbi:kinase [Candidatus Merdisoma sp. JLR.KK011]|uniref:zeta toxin family protein n=1 Tax=Candidatus Merdisoma sp. JLR.KK011 TaxID=3114299 RepID=UPI002FEF1BD6